MMTEAEEKQALALYDYGRLIRIENALKRLSERPEVNYISINYTNLQLGWVLKQILEGKDPTEKKQ